MSQVQVYKVLVAGVVLFLLNGLASGEESPLDTGLACSSITSDTERLACFDQWVESLDERAGVLQSVPEPTEAAEPAPVATPVAESAAEEADSEGDFGLPPVAPAENLESIVSTVVSADYSRQDRVVITLANDQVWRQTRGSTLRLDPGDEVTVDRKMFGSFSLTKSGSSRSMRVKRIR